ncbi:MAG TPA: VOC family protein, partial [Microlunatus sp.]|nr:VOC family protein [Microlunatus sp.]
MSRSPVLRSVDAVTVPVPDLDAGLRFYRDSLGHELLWRNDSLGQAGLRLPRSDTELVLCVDVAYQPTWLVDDVRNAVAEIVAAGGTVVAEPHRVPVGLLAVVADPFGTALVLI